MKGWMYRVLQNLHVDALRRQARTAISLDAPSEGDLTLAEILPDGMNLFVWDFGVDGPPTAKPAKH